MNRDTFFRLPGTSAPCTIVAGKYTDAAILINYDDDDFARGYGLIKEAFRALRKDDILQPYKADFDFRSSNVTVDDVGYKLYVFDIKYQRSFTAAQTIKVEFKFVGVVPNDTNGYALILTTKLVKRSSDGQRHFDLL